MTVLSNVRHTYITPPGEGFLPRDTAQHHRQWALKVIGDAVENAGVSMHDLDCICFTKGRSILYSLIELMRINVGCRTRDGCASAVRCSRCSDAVSPIRQASRRRKSLRRPCVPFILPSSHRTKLTYWATYRVDRHRNGPQHHWRTEPRRSVRLGR